MEKEPGNQTENEQTPTSSRSVGKVVGGFAIALLFALLAFAMFNSHLN